MVILSLEVVNFSFLKKVFFQVLLILLQNMELLLKKTPSSMIQNHILPMLSAALGSSSIQIQELCMSIVPNFADRLDLQSLKTSILPKIRHIAIEGGTISVSGFQTIFLDVTQVKLSLQS